MTTTPETAALTTAERLEQRRITSTTEVTPHRFLYQWDSKPCFARGELVALTGKAKSGKTYVASILMALTETTPLMGLSRPDDEPLKTLWIDTEQSEDSTKEILCTRIASLIGHQPDDEHLAVYNLRQEDWQNRLDFVTTAICIHQPDLVIFDGIRDVVGDINDYRQAQNVLTKLLSIASFSDACIVCVLHQNKAIEDKTLRGALGTELQNKSFETYECTKDPDTHVITMRQTATRKYDISARLIFSVSDSGMPVLSSTPPTMAAERTFAPNTTFSPLNPAYLNQEGKIDKQKLFAYILPDGKRMSWMQLRAVVMRVTNIQSFKFADTILTDAVQEKIVREVEGQEGSHIYELHDGQNEIF